MASSVPGELDLVDLSDVARSCAESLGDRSRCIGLDCELAEDLPLVLADPYVLGELAQRLARRAAEVIAADWGAVTLATGLLGMERSTLARDSSWSAFPACSHAYLEVHTTGPAVGPLDCELASNPFGARGFGPLDLPKALGLLRELDGEIVIDRLATAGTSVVLLLPFAGTDLPC